MTRLYDNPPEEITHFGHELKLATSDEPFRCNGCKEPGYGPRYTRDCGGKSFDLHTCCALKDTLVHPLFGDHRTFKFLTEPPPPVDKTICDACGDPAHGYVYHYHRRHKEDLDLHPCCASLKESIMIDGRVFDLCREASQPCGRCLNNNDRRRDFWAYRTYLEGKAVYLHVACMKEMARLSWDSAFQNRVGGAQIIRPSDASIEIMLRSIPGNTRSSDGFVRIARTVVSAAIAVIFGNPTAMVAAVAGGVADVLRT